MVQAGLWVPRQQRASKIQQPRYRRACCGELIQVDAANNYADEFMSGYNRRFAKAPRHVFDVHRPLETDDGESRAVFQNPDCAV